MSLINMFEDSLRALPQAFRLRFSGPGDFDEPGCQNQPHRPQKWPRFPLHFWIKVLDNDIETEIIRSVAVLDGNGPKFG